MARIEVSSCIMCEDARPESNGRKATLIGYLGVLPNVEVFVQDLTLPISRLTFLYSVQPSQGGPATLRYQILDPMNKHILPVDQSASMDFANLPGGNLIIGLQGLRLTVAGIYKTELFVDDELVHESSFSVREGILADEPVRTPLN